ncbi:hypothetical protein [Pistricoccus aurantiacus]|uniref:hypothetical protein n=1 Tax=Pistricoccus aurantiacus TaxID=1883414 RepID=UPI0036306668
MSRLSIVVLSLTTITLLSACAAPQPSWQKDGVSRHDTTTSRSECLYEIRINDIPQSERQEVLAHCMQGKGFRLKR